MADSQSVADPTRVGLAVENAGSSESTIAEAENSLGSVPTDVPTEETTETDTPTSPPASSEEPSATPTEPPAPPATPTETPTPTPSPSIAQEDQVVALVNATREQSGCEPLQVVSELVDAARAHSTDMSVRGYFDHTTPDGIGFDERIITAGYPEPGAENIAHGQRSATQVMNSWMESDGHRANILNCQFTTIGVGLEKDGWYWTQNFGY